MTGPAILVLALATIGQQVQLTRLARAIRRPAATCGATFPNAAGGLYVCERAPHPELVHQDGDVKWGTFPIEEHVRGR